MDREVAGHVFGKLRMRRRIRAGRVGEGEVEAALVHIESDPVAGPVITAVG